MSAAKRLEAKKIGYPRTKESETKSSLHCRFCKVNPIHEEGRDRGDEKGERWSQETVFHSKLFDDTS